MPSSTYQTRRPGGNYFAAFGGAPRNMGAAYGVPDQTYGGRAAGGPTPFDHATNMALFPARNGPQNQYRPLNQPGMMEGPLTNQSYVQGMQNLGVPYGSHFQNTLPAWGFTGSGGMRPMFHGVPQAPQGVGQQQQNAWAAQNGMYTNHQTGTMSPLNGVQSGSTGFNNHDIRAMQIAGQGPNYKPPANLQQMQQDYFSRTSQNMAGRQAGVQANAFNSSQARKARMGIGDPLDMAMRQNPQIAGMMGMGQMGLQGQMGQQALGWGQLAQQGQQQHFQNMAALAGHVAGMQGVPPGLQQGYMNQIMQQFGLQGQQGGGMTGTGQQRANYSLTPQQQGQFRGLKTAKEKEEWLNKNGVMDPITRQHLLGVGGPQHPGLGQQFGDAVAGGILNIPHYLNPGNWGSNGPAAFEGSGQQGYMQKWLSPYEVTGLSPQAKRALKGGKK